MRKLWNVPTVLHVLHSYLFFFVWGGCCACSCTSELTGFCSEFPFYELFLLNNIVNRLIRLLRFSVLFTTTKSCVLRFWSVGPLGLAKFWTYVSQKAFTSADVAAARCLQKLKDDQRRLGNVVLAVGWNRDQMCTALSKSNSWLSIRQRFGVWDSRTCVVPSAVFSDQCRDGKQELLQSSLFDG